MVQVVPGRFTGPSDLEPWRRFMRQVAKSDAVGVWHETYGTDGPDARLPT